METWAAAALAMSLGMRSGLTRRGPRSSRRRCWASSSFSPPMPEPMMAPAALGRSFAKSMPDMRTASCAAIIANCANRSIRFETCGSMSFSGSKSFTSPAICVG